MPRKTVSRSRARTAGRIRVHRENPPDALRVTIIRGTRERVVGPRGWLTLAEAAAVMRRPVAAVRQSIRAGFLPARRRGTATVLTLAAVDRYLREEAEDIAMVRARRRDAGRGRPAEEVFARFGL
jgi:hypothetical protein